MSDRAQLIELDPETCEELLASGRVGRVAVNDEPSPTVLPVNYRYRDRTVVFVTASGRKLRAAEDEEPASFEVDGFDVERRSGWSVLARGILRSVEAGTEAASLAAEVRPFPDGERPHPVRLDVQELTGVQVPADPTWSEQDLPTNVWYGQDGTDLLG